LAGRAWLTPPNGRSTWHGRYHGLWDREPSKGNELAEAIKDRLQKLTEERLRRRAGPPDASATE
jgi:hypothetical protein